MKTRLLLLLLVPMAATAWAGQSGASGYLHALETEARSAGGFGGFSAARGQRFFNAQHGSDWRCATCHTKDPLAAGQHARTGRDIAPLAPSANPERFADASKANKWFRRNCNDVVGRACTAVEKGDVLVWLMSLK
jgi:hypothetical protein